MVIMADTIKRNEAEKLSNRNTLIATMSQVFSKVLGLCLSSAFFRLRD